jgi:hypothetical protein
LLREVGIYNRANAVLVFRQFCAFCNRVFLRLLCKPPGAIAFLCLLVTARIFRPLPRNLVQVVERMVDFVAKGQLVGRWFTVSARAAIVSVTVLNATNLAFMAASSYFYFQGLFSRTFTPQGLNFSHLQALLL